MSEACYEMLFREVHPHTWILQYAKSNLDGSILRWMCFILWLDLPRVATLRSFLLKPERLVTKILEGAISQICPYAHFQKSCYYFYYLFFISLIFFIFIIFLIFFLKLEGFFWIIDAFENKAKTNLSCKF